MVRPGLAVLIVAAFGAGAVPAAGQALSGAADAAVSGASAAAGAGAAAVPPLASLSRYESLLAVQAAGTIPDLTSLVRPGIAMPVDGRLAILQGSGRYESLRAGENADLFVPEDAALPASAVPVERGVPGALVRAANLLSSRGRGSSNPLVVDAAVAGRTFVRVLAPREALDAPMSDALRDIERLLERLRADPAVWDAARARVASPAFQALSARERRDVLRVLAARR